MKLKKITTYVLNYYYFEAVGAQRHKGATVTRRLWVRSPLEEMNYLFKYIFPFSRSSVETSGVEFRNSTRSVSKIWRRVGNGVT